MGEHVMRRNYLAISMESGLYCCLVSSSCARHRCGCTYLGALIWDHFKAWVHRFPHQGDD